MFTVVIIAVGAGVAQAHSIWWIVAVIAVASLSMQAGYFFGMLFQHFFGAVLASKYSPLSHTTSARNTYPKEVARDESGGRHRLQPRCRWI